MISPWGPAGKPGKGLVHVAIDRVWELSDLLHRNELRPVRRVRYHKRRQ